jgi:hypothetical protein
MVPARDFVPALAPNSAVRQAACRQAHDVSSQSNMRSSRRGRLHCLAGLSRDRPRFRIRRAFPKHRAPGFKYSRVPPSGSATIRREGQARRHRERRDQRRIGGQRNIYRLQSLGANVVAIGALLVLGDTIRAFAADKHLPLELLKHMPNNLWAPSQCPLCAAGNRSKLSAHPKGICAVNRPASSTPVALIPAIRLCNDSALKTKRRI